MPGTKERLRTAAVKAGGKARAALKKVEQRLEREVRKRRVRRAVREVAEGAAVAGMAVLTGAVMDQAARAIRGRGRAKAATPALGPDLHLQIPCDAAISRVTDALRAEGFGVLSRIDVHRTFQEKLGVNFRAYTILGACNPELALRALTARPDLGLLLPCNVTIESDPAGSVVRVADPEVLLKGLDGLIPPDIREVARDAKRRLGRVMDSLREHAGAQIL